MSRILSTAIYNPIASSGKSNTVRINVMATKLAAGIPATPMEVNNASSTTRN